MIEVISRPEKDILIHLEKFKIITIKQCATTFYKGVNCSYDEHEKSSESLKKRL